MIVCTVAPVRCNGVSVYVSSSRPHSPSPLLSLIVSLGMCDMYFFKIERLGLISIAGIQFRFPVEHTWLPQTHLEKTKHKNSVRRERGDLAHGQGRGKEDRHRTELARVDVPRNRCQMRVDTTNTVHTVLMVTMLKIKLWRIIISKFETMATVFVLNPVVIWAKCQSDKPPQYPMMPVVVTSVLSNVLANKFRHNKLIKMSSTLTPKPMVFRVCLS